MESIAFGLRTGQPSEYLIFINILIGKLLLFLYSNFPAINWYPILFYLLHFLAMTILLHCLLQKKRFVFGLVYFLLIFAFFELFLLTNLQFTTTAFITAISGAFLFLTYMDSEGLKFYIATSASISILIISGLLRSSALYLTLGVFSAILLLKLIKKPRIRIPVFLLIVIVLLTISNQYDRSYYNKNSQWKFFYEYNKLRVNITDYPYFTYSDKNKDIYDSAGWSENDVKMFRSWFFNDLELYSREKLQYLTDNISNKRGLRETLQTLKAAFISLNMALRLFLLFFLMLIIFRTLKDKNKYLPFILVPPVSAIVFLSYSGRLPNRIFMPLIFFIVVASIFLIKPFNMNFPLDKSKNRTFGIIALSICIVITAIAYLSTSFSSSINRLEQEKFEIKINEMVERNKIYIRWGAVGLEDKAISFTAPKSLKNLKFINQGWEIHSPTYIEIMEKNQINNIYHDIIQRDDIYVICYKGQVEWYKIFMKEHFGEMVESTIIDDFNKISKIYQFFIPSNSISNLIRRVYALSQGLEIENSKLTVYLKNIEAKEMNLSQILASLAFSKNSFLWQKNNNEFLSLLYIMLLDRKADEKGLKHWLMELDEGKTRMEIFDSFLVSREFQRKYNLQGEDTN